jgi:hypothetical protein
LHLSIILPLHHPARKNEAGRDLIRAVFGKDNASGITFLTECGAGWQPAADC